MANFVKLPPEILAFKDKYKIGDDDIWLLPGKKSYAVKHKALERIAAEVGIKFERPAMLETDLNNKIAAMIVFASLGDCEEWSTGEAAPWNCQNNYTLAMAEKRAKDRCILKLLRVHGDIYSQEELEPERKNPHVTTPSDISDAAVEFDQYGNPVDNIPMGDPGIIRRPKAKCRDDFEAYGKAMMSTKTEAKLFEWAELSRNMVASFPLDWDEIMRKRFAEHRDEIRAKQKEAA